MLIRRSFRPSRVVGYVRWELLLLLTLSVGVWVLDRRGGTPSVSLPFAPLGVLGTALAILLGFRNNTGYARWWEARTLWGTLHASSRTVARLVVTGVDNARAMGKGESDALARAFQVEMLWRIAAFAHALRLTLREQHADADWRAVRELLPVAEWEHLEKIANRPHAIIGALGARLKYGVRVELLGAFDPISIEPHMAALHQVQAGCERLKHTPLLRQYDIFTRLFLWTFLVLLPPSLLGILPIDGSRWLVMPLSILIGFVYAITQRVGQVTEAPFESRPQDVPLTTLCIELERDLREMLGDAALPPLPLAIDGALY